MAQTAEALQKLVDDIAASVAIVECDTKQQYRVVAYNQLFLQMLGQESTKIPKPCLLSALVSAAAAELFSTYLPAVFQLHEAIEIERSFGQSKQAPWWRLFLNPMEDATTKPKRVMIIGIHINETHDEFQTENSRFSSVIDTAYDGIISIDTEQRITLFNHAAERMFEYQASEVLGRFVTCLMPEKYRNAHAGYIHQFSKSNILSRNRSDRVLITGVKKSGVEFPAEISISKIVVEGELEFTAIIRDISNRLALIDKLTLQANTDNLTGLKNRTYFNQQLDNMSLQFKRFNMCFSILMLDLDNFKLLNDNHGHLFGDEVLKQFSKAASGVLREVDLLARYGGEEFIALLPNTNLAQAKDSAERVRKKIEHLNVTNDKDNIVKFTVSIGIAEFQVTDDTKSLVARADEALYRAKHLGRNSVSK
ncbi:sensor domain-containing diguanylate cyclase [Shewanella sp. UCD-KL12]|uniref:sensor domain-containing diguanylate cyclase n=1 Tax=Shewanella sp. UCD-KL12 TaxID=1917163 RepID=UPI0009702BED|nr:sensor domain-containing diguanylate cyclase [Shewanella sp. UCD-KL12]